MINYPNIRWLSNTNPIFLPFLHFTVGLTRVVHKACNVSHTVSVDYCPAIQIEAIMMTFLSILFRHPSTKLLFTDHFSTVFRDEISYRFIHTTFIQNFQAKIQGLLKDFLREYLYF